MLIVGVINEGYYPSSLHWFLYDDVIPVLDTGIQENRITRKATCFKNSILNQFCLEHKGVIPVLDTGIQEKKEHRSSERKGLVL